MDTIQFIKDNIYFTWFALLLFFWGFSASIIVYQLNIKSLMYFPQWFIKILSKWVNPKVSFFQIFSIIFLFNTISIFLYMMSGVFLIFPAVIAFVTGMNIGLTIFVPQDESLDKQAIRLITDPIKALRMVIFSNFVLLLEIMTFCFAVGMGISLASGASYVTNDSLASVIYLSQILEVRVQAYIHICVPVLAISALMEASVIKGL